MNKIFLMISLLSSYTFCMQDTGFVDGIQTEQRGNTVNFSNPKNIVMMAYNQHKQKTIITNGLDGITDLEFKLQQQLYQEILPHLWNEGDSVKKIAWLLERANEGHVIFMFELVRELTNVNKFEEAFIWLTIAKIKTQQDINCCADRSVRGAIDILHLTYNEFFISKIVKKFKDDSKMIFERLQEDNWLTILNYVSDKIAYQSPLWIGYSGISAFFEEPKLIPQEQWQEKRSEVLTEVEKNLKLDFKDYCLFCKKTDVNLQRCAACKSVRYCSVDCQRHDWPIHKAVCKERAQNRKPQ